MHVAKIREVAAVLELDKIKRKRKKRKNGKEKAALHRVSGPSKEYTTDSFSLLYN